MPVGSRAVDALALAALVDWDYVRDWLGLVRWLHVVAAIFWVGITAYFVLVDNYMRPAQASDATDDLIGERYVLHGGSLYFVRRHTHAGRKLPSTTYWSSPWYAYVTWISGFSLMVVAYYWDARGTLVDTTRWDMSGLAAVAISLGVLALGFLVYVVVSRLLVRTPALCWAALFALIAGTAWGVSELFTERAVYIQVGALMGTWMTTNVLFVFVPAHRLQEQARRQGKSIDPAVARRAAQRGTHNTYMALPVLVAMLSGHWTVLSGSEHPVVAFLVVLVLAGMLRLFFVKRQQDEPRWWIPVTCAVVIVALAIWVKPPAPESLAQQPAEQAEEAPQPATPQEAEPEPEPEAEPAPAPDAEAEAEPDSPPAADGAALFSANCASCHTLAAADASGSVGPNLDGLAPDAAHVAETVRQGRGVMPSFEGKLAPEEIDALAEYVGRVAGG
jgi:uncharacterized membrane protein